MIFQTIIDNNYVPLVMAGIADAIVIIAYFENGLGTLELAGIIYCSIFTPVIIASSFDKKKNMFGLLKD